MRRRWQVPACVALIALPVAGMTALGTSNAVTSLAQDSGTAWVASPHQGLLSLIDGPADEVEATVRIKGVDHALDVSQAGSSAYLTDRTVGSVALVEGATSEVDKAVAFGTAADSGLRVLQGHDHVYVVDPAQSLAYLVDPDTLKVHDQIALGAAPGAGQSVVDDAGNLWAVDSARGGLTWYDGTKHVDRGAAARTDQLVLTQGSPVLVDPEAGTVRQVSPSGSAGRATCLDIPKGAGAELLGSQDKSEIYAAVASTGTLVIAGVGHDDCGRVVKIGTPGTGTYSALAQSGRFVFVPDRSSGVTIVVDTRKGTVAGTFPLADPGHALELTAAPPASGMVFYNDRDGSAAGVLRLVDGIWRRAASLEKFNPTTGAPATPLTLPESPAPRPKNTPTATATATPGTGGSTKVGGKGQGGRGNGPGQGGDGPGQGGNGPGQGGGGPTTPTPPVTSATAIPPTKTYGPVTIRSLSVNENDATNTLSVTPAVEGDTADLEWHWHLVAQPGGVKDEVTAPGASLPVAWQTNTVFSVTLTLVREGQPVGALTQPFAVAAPCSPLPVSPNPVDLRRAGAVVVITVKAPQGCAGTVAVTVSPAGGMGWIAVQNSSFTLAAGTSHDVTLTAGGTPPTDGLNAPGLNVTAGTASQQIGALGNRPPVITAASCTYTLPTYDPARKPPIIAGKIVVTGAFSDATPSTVRISGPPGITRTGPVGHFSSSAKLAGSDTAPSTVKVTATDEFGAAAHIDVTCVDAS